MRFKDYLRKSGYQLFLGTVDATVYSMFDCPVPRRAIWYYREGSYQCAGCKQHCETDSPVGFQIFLEIR